MLNTLVIKLCLQEFTRLLGSDISTCAVTFVHQATSDLQVVQDDAGAEQVVVDADEVRQLRVQHDTDALFPQSESLLLRHANI